MREEPFTIDPGAVNNAGDAILSDTNFYLGIFTDLQTTITVEVGNVPAIVEYPLTSFAKAVTDALHNMLQQRVDIALALNNAASQAQLQEIQTANLFRGQGPSGVLPLAPISLPLFPQPPGTNPYPRTDSPFFQGPPVFQGPPGLGPFLPVQPPL